MTIRLAHWPGRKLGRLRHLGPNCPSFPGPSFPFSPMLKLENSDLSDEVVRLFHCPNYRISPMHWKKTRTCWNSKKRTSRTKRSDFSLCPNYRISSMNSSRLSIFSMNFSKISIFFLNFGTLCKLQKVSWLFKFRG